MVAARNMIIRHTVGTVMLFVVLLSACSEARPVNFQDNPALCFGKCAADVFTCMTSCAFKGTEAPPCALKCNTDSADCIAKCSPGNTPPAPAALVPAPTGPIVLDASVDCIRWPCRNIALAPVTTQF